MLGMTQPSAGVKAEGVTPLYLGSSKRIVKKNKNKENDYFSCLCRQPTVYPPLPRLTCE